MGTALVRGLGLPAVGDLKARAVLARPAVAVVPMADMPEHSQWVELATLEAGCSILGRVAEATLAVAVEHGSPLEETMVAVGEGRRTA